MRFGYSIHSTMKKTKINFQFFQSSCVIITYAKTKIADQLRCSSPPLLPLISSHLLWLYSPVCAGPGRKARRQVSHFSLNLSDITSPREKLFPKVSRRNKSACTYSDRDIPKNKAADQPTWMSNRTICASVVRKFKRHVFS